MKRNADITLKCAFYFTIIERRAKEDLKRGRRKTWILKPHAHTGFMALVIDLNAPEKNLC